MAFINVTRFTAVSSGTGDFVVSAAVTGYQTPASAGAIDGAPYYYRAQSNDLTQWEVGVGVYTASSVTIARTTVLFSSSGSKVSFSSAPQVAFVAAAESLREKLTANRTYYVRSDGSDSNGGFANTAGGAFLTIQKAVDTVAALDCSTFDTTINIADGTYAENVNLKTLLGSGSCNIVGNTSTPANVVVGTAAAVGVFYSSQKITAVYNLSGMKLANASGALLWPKGPGAQINYTAMNFGACSSSYPQIYASTGAEITYTGNYTISGGGNSHWQAQFPGSLITNGGATPTITVSGTPAFAGAFAVAVDQAEIADVNGITFSGSATGSRYSASRNGLINTNGSGATYFPGDSAGTTATQGQYL